MTEPLQWTPEMSVDIPEIDAQHQSLFAIINELRDKENEGAAPETILAIIGRLVDYSNDHFKDEENLLMDCGYPRLGQHSSAHLGYIKKMDFFIQDFSENRQGLTVEILEFLTQWWMEHITHVDMDYARHIHAR